MHYKKLFVTSDTVHLRATILQKAETSDTVKQNFQGTVFLYSS